MKMQETKKTLNILHSTFRNIIDNNKNIVLDHIQMLKTYKRRMSNEH